MTIALLPKRPHHSNGGFHEPKTEYYFLTYQVISSPQWVRSPFLKLSEVKDVLEELPFLLTPGVVPSNKSNLPGMIPDYENLQIYSESWLSQLHRDWDELNQKYADSEFTNRQVIFGNLYERSAEHFTGVPSLSRQDGEDKGIWQERVEEQRSAIKEQRMERMLLHGELADNQGNLPALLALRLKDEGATQDIPATR
jgi:hypothetical protein